MDDLDKELNRIRYLIAEMTLKSIPGQDIFRTARGFSLQDILEHLNNTNWDVWIDEAQQRGWPITSCERCCHNITWSEELIEQRGTRICDTCWEDIIHYKLTCMSCQETFIRDMRKLPNQLPASDPHKGPLCETCQEKILDRYRVPCAQCGAMHVAYNHTSLSLCRACNTPKNQREKARIISHNERAQALYLPATLTLQQWLKALNYFDWKCAYCQGEFKSIEHYTPLSSDGSTSADNCLPSCKRCNTRKSDKHPDRFEHLFPAENILKIKAYIEMVKDASLNTLE